MQISGITTQKDTSKSSNGIVIQKSMNSDSYSDNLRNQIDSKQKALESLNENDEMSPKMKIEKRKELQQEIADLEAEIREHELEEKKKEEEKLQKEKDALEGNTRHTSKDGDTATISKAGMQSIIAAENAIDNVEQTNGIHTTMTDQANILESEIELDKQRGADTSKKEGALADIQSRINKLNESVNDQLEDIDDEMED